MTSGSNLSAPRACADAGPGSANRVLLPRVERLARHFVLTRQIALVAELPADERDVVLKLAPKWAASYPDSRRLRFTWQEPYRICGGYEAPPRGAGVRCHGDLSQTSPSTEPIQASAGIGR